MGANGEDGVRKRLRSMLGVEFGSGYSQYAKNIKPIFPVREHGCIFHNYLVLELEVS